MTDCNVLLGKVQAQYFPAVFGPGGDQPLDRDVVVEKFRALAAKIATALDAPMRSPEELAEGFLRIAVENMANAIKKICPARIRCHRLHAEQLRRRRRAARPARSRTLGMEQVFLHPFAGVLSAFGMGLADVRASRQFQFDRPLSDLAAAAPVFETRKCVRPLPRKELLPTASASTSVSMSARRAHTRACRWRWMAFAALTVAFIDAHQQRYELPARHQRAGGRDARGRRRGTHVGGSGAGSTALSGAAHIDDCAVHLGGTAQTVPVFERARLAEGETIDGPALLTEDTGTTMVEPGWRAQCLSGGNLLLRRVEGWRGRTRSERPSTRIMLEVFNNQFMAIADQMGATLENTAYSVNIKERLDFSCALFDARGDLGRQRAHVPVHLGSMSESVKKILQENAGHIRPGDVFMMNNPFNGGTHFARCDRDHAGFRCCPRRRRAGDRGDRSQSGGTMPISVAAHPGRPRPTAAISPKKAW